MTDTPHTALAQRSTNDRSEQAIDAFLELVSHELRTPLSSIVANVELLLDEGEDLTDPMRDRCLEVVNRSSMRLAALIDELLFAAQLHSSPLRLRLAPLDLAALAAEAIVAAAPRATAQDVKLVFEGTPVVLPADRDRLRHAVEGLVGNAIKYSLSGGTVTVRVASDGPEAVLEVEDEGIGIATDDQPHVFNRFFRGANAAELHVPGAGLGLMVVQRIVQAHGGQIAVRSQLSQGTTFRLLLPVSAGPDLTTAKENQDAEHPGR